MHFPVGMLGAWLIDQSPAIGIMFTAYFGLYEVMNDWRKADKSYKDVIGAVFGFGVMAVGILLWRLI